MRIVTRRRGTDMSDYEYVIKGDTERFKDCLVFVCGSSEERANEILNRMLTNPNDNDKRLIKGHSNLRVTKVQKDFCWWNKGCD